MRGATTRAVRVRVRVRVKVRVRVWVWVWVRVRWCNYSSSYVRGSLVISERSRSRSISKDEEGVAP
jgi:hypothetical protein